MVVKAYFDFKFKQRAFAWAQSLLLTQIANKKRDKSNQCYLPLKILNTDLNYRYWKTSR